MNSANPALKPGSEQWHDYREKAKTNLYWLNAKVLNHEQIVPMTYEAHYAMCLFAERKTGIPAVDRARIQLIQVWRGMGKTTLITKGRTIQRLLNDIDWAAGIGNERQDNADAFLGTIKTELETNGFLNMLFPELMKGRQRGTEWKASRIIAPGRTRPNPINPSVLATGTGATVTGVHMNEWIIDDLLSQDAAENARTGSFTEIEKLNRWVPRLQPLLTRPKEDPITFIGTPWWPGDSYDYIRDFFGHGEKPQIYNWTLRLPDGKPQVVKIEVIDELAIFHFPAIQDGHVIHPKQFAEDGTQTSALEALDKLRDEDPGFFSAQYLLQPTAGAIVAFREEYLREFEWENRYQLRYRDHEGKVCFERTQDLQIIMSVDPAISPKSAAARSAITVVGSNGSKLFLLEAWARRTSPTEVATQILEFYKLYHPTRIIIESVAYQMALAEILKLLAAQDGLSNLPIFEYHSGADHKGKMRITGLEPYFRKGLFYFNRDSQRDFLQEYLTFSPEIGNRLVDILDCLSFQKVSWEMLRMLGEDHNDQPAMGSAEWRNRQQGAIQKLRDRFTRKNLTREWDDDKWSNVR